MREFLRRFDWVELPIETKDRLNRVRNEILEDLSEDQIRNAIVTGDTSTLNSRRQRSSSRSWICMDALSLVPLTLVLNWISPVTTLGVEGRAGQHPGGLTSLLIPGPQVCRPPGSGVSEQARLRERHIQDTVEKPMIPQLLAGEGEFQGARGFEPTCIS